jgi:murein L,D-transpeptidase YcbB/YkuD
MILHGMRIREVRGLIELMAAAVALTTAGCVSSEAPPPTVAAAAPTPEAPTSAYVTMLRSQGIEAGGYARGKVVLVNIPSFELIALQDGVPVLRSRVIVGRPATPTPELTSSLYAIQFNPAWTPTPSMIRNEGLHYMPPGPDNPLGRMMFALDNDEFIYLHDTNEKYLFKRGQRALSHGCVRVEQARALAAWALDVPQDEIDRMIAKGTYSVPLPEDIPVSLAYYTRFPDEHDAMVEYPDLYRSRQAESRDRQRP